MAIFGFEGERNGGNEINDDIYGSLFTCTENGTATSMTAWLRTPGASCPVKLAIYRASDYLFIGGTEPLTIDTLGDWNQITFDFLVQPSLEANTEYLLVAWGDAGDCRLGTHNSLQVPYIRDRVEYEPTWPQNLVPEVEETGNVFTLFCTYTPATDCVFPICDCDNEVDCVDVGCYWYATSTYPNGHCWGTQLTDCSYIRQEDCENPNNGTCYWYNGSCHATAPTCEELLNQTDCEDYSCYWYATSAYPNGHCWGTQLTDCSYIRQVDCENPNNGTCYWYNGACHSEPSPEGIAEITSMYTVPAVPQENEPFILYIQVTNIGSTDTIWLDVYEGGTIIVNFARMLDADDSILVTYNHSGLSGATTFLGDAGHMEDTTKVLDDSLELVVTPTPPLPCINPTGIHGQLDPCGDGGANQPLPTYSYLCNDGVWDEENENCPACPACVSPPPPDEIPWMMLAAAGATSVAIIAIAVLAKKWVKK